MVRFPPGTHDVTTVWVGVGLVYRRLKRLEDLVGRTWEKEVGVVLEGVFRELGFSLYEKKGPLGKQ